MPVGERSASSCEVFWVLRCLEAGCLVFWVVGVIRERVVFLGGQCQLFGWIVVAFVAVVPGGWLLPEVLALVVESAGRVAGLLLPGQALWLVEAKLSCFL